VVLAGLMVQLKLLTIDFVSKQMESLLLCYQPLILLHVAVYGIAFLMVVMEDKLEQLGLGLNGLVLFREVILKIKIHVSLTLCQNVVIIQHNHNINHVNIFHYGGLNVKKNALTLPIIIKIKNMQVHHID
jgi:hypothetical protein